MVDQTLVRPRVVLEFLVQVGLFERHQIVNAGHFGLFVLLAPGGADLFVVRFWTAIERGQQVVADAANVQFVQLSAALGAMNADELVAGDANFLAGIQIVVVGVDRDPAPLRPATLSSTLSAAIRLV